MTSYSTKKIAQEDIVCYKHIYELNGVYYSSFKDMVIELKELYTANIEISVDDHNIGPGLHSYQKLHSADLDARHYNELVVSCTIPKGSEYYTGMSGGHPAYVSNKLIYNEILNRYDLCL